MKNLNALRNKNLAFAIHYNKHKNNAEKLSRKIGNKSKLFKADLENPEECEKLFNDVVKEFGHIDVLVNNAGRAIISPIKSKNWIQDWDKTMAINLRAAGILCRLAIQHFKSLHTFVLKSPPIANLQTVGGHCKVAQQTATTR